MSGILNLESALRTCKVDTAYQQRIQSDRFLNPKNLVCPVWNGLDTAGRVACADSFYTKREGCNSAQDRVGVENILRPQYMQYISDSLGNSYNNNSPTPGAAKSDVGVEGFMDFDTEGKDYSKITGNFGGQLAHNVYPRTCSARRYDEYSETVMKTRSS
jgi:hypothetical protein